MLNNCDNLKEARHLANRMPGCFACILPRQHSESYLVYSLSSLLVGEAVDIPISWEEKSMSGSQMVAAGVWSRSGHIMCNRHLFSQSSQF